MGSDPIFLFTMNSCDLERHEQAAEGSSKRKRGSDKARMRVHFAKILEIVHEFELQEAFEDSEDVARATSSKTKSSTKRTSEMTFLSSIHGRARRELREIDVLDLQSAVKHGVKTRGRNCPKTGMPRWKYTHGNIVHITDYTSTVEVTSYKQAISIEQAKITPEMLRRHNRDRLTLDQDPHLCTTHSVVIIDQSGSMRASDVKGFKTRSQAAYGLLALDYIAEQLHPKEEQDVTLLDAVSVIEMKDSGTLIYQREPMDWVFFNKLLDRQLEAKPKSHGNYYQALHLADILIQQELEAAEDIEREDLLYYQVVFVSDGKPSDKDPLCIELQESILTKLATELKENFGFFAIGLGESDTDFDALDRLAKVVEANGSSGTFKFSNLSCFKLGEELSSAAKKATSSRVEKLSKGRERAPRQEKDVQLRGKFVPNSERTFARYTGGVSRWRYDHSKYKDSNEDWPWVEVDFKNGSSVGFDMEKNPFGKGAERLAYMFYEIGRDKRRQGNALVAKETIYVDRDQDRQVKFHETFCRTQWKSQQFAKIFNRVVRQTPALRPVEHSMRTPDVLFLDCHVYEYVDVDGSLCGLLVEDYLKGKFTKYSSNNGYVKRNLGNFKTIEMEIGEVYMSDFLHAFSHWVYFHSDQNLLVCDLQGVLNEEGRYPRFELTDPCICTKKRNTADSMV